MQSIENVCLLIRPMEEMIIQRPEVDSVLRNLRNDTANSGN